MDGHDQRRMGGISMWQEREALASWEASKALPLEIFFIFCLLLWIVWWVYKTLVFKIGLLAFSQQIVFLPVSKETCCYFCYQSVYSYRAKLLKNVLIPTSGPSLLQQRRIMLVSCIFFCHIQSLWLFWHVFRKTELGVQSTAGGNPAASSWQAWVSNCTR